MSEVRSMTALPTDSRADLIARLEALEGPDREADEAIARLTGWSPTGGIPATGAPSHWYSAAFGMPAYTASLDAAVDLVERVLPGGTMSTLREAMDLMYARGGWEGHHVPQMLPRFIVVALLRALQYLEDQGKAGGRDGH